MKNKSRKRRRRNQSLFAKSRRRRRSRRRRPVRRRVRRRSRRRRAGRRTRARRGRGRDEDLAVLRALTGWTDAATRQLLNKYNGSVLEATTSFYVAEQAKRREEDPVAFKKLDKRRRAHDEKNKRQIAKRAAEVGAHTKKKKDDEMLELIANSLYKEQMKMTDGVGDANYAPEEMTIMKTVFKANPHYPYISKEFGDRFQDMLKHGVDTGDWKIWTTKLWVATKNMRKVGSERSKEYKNVKTRGTKWAHDFFGAAINEYTGEWEPPATAEKKRVEFLPGSRLHRAQSAPSKQEVRDRETDQKGRSDARQGDAPLRGKELEDLQRSQKMEKNRINLRKRGLAAAVSLMDPYDVAVLNQREDAQQKSPPRDWKHVDQERVDQERVGGLSTYW